ncbi:hypothetical protein [Inquilinus limosus]|uniref:Uncharacterized protein n=1 Tax=Inquilinus limosus TaxID=171674 RepID=A0A211ZTW2_9PROT|nr:hypothetical protein [Inquilinus limosus]OWJ68711.1 hypothetical protein BWR60_02885 [Inquilinus limosus]
MRIANISPGPRFLYARGRARLVEPGETVELDLSEAEAESVRQQAEAGLLAVTDPPAGEEKAVRARRPGRGGR